MDGVIQVTTATSCACCGTCITGTFECRTRGGTASLCGASEYTSPSTPPKKYRTQTFSGTLDICTYQGSPPCTFAAYHDRFIFSGALTTNSSTCISAASPVTSSAGTNWAGSGPTPNTCSGISFSIANIVSDNNASPNAPTDIGNSLITKIGFNIFQAANTAEVTYTATTFAWSSASICRGLNDIPSGAVTAVLTDEDTDSDAVARLLAGGGGTWSGWSAGSSTTCLAHYEQRTGFSFAYQESQWRVTASGLAPGQTYSTNIDIYRRPFGSGSYVLYQSLMASDVADGAGNLEITGDVPNDVGFETYAQQAPC